MKILIALGVLIAVLVAALIGFIGWYRWDSALNRGYESGYYGEFNRISNSLVSIPGVVVTNSWYNADISLEEFSFSLTVTGQPVFLGFEEKDPVRALEGDALMAALQQRIGTALAVLQTNK